MLTIEKAKTLLSVYAPALVVGVTDEKLKVLLEVAASHRPLCLSDAKGDEAEIYYLVYLLLLAKATDTQQANDLRSVQSAKVGEEQVSFAVSGADLTAGAPDYWLAKWQALDDICSSLGAITVSGGGSCCCSGGWGA